MTLPGSGDTELRPVGKENVPQEDVEETRETQEVAEEKEQLDRATFNVEEDVELKGDYKEAEEIQKTFEVVVESTPVKIVEEPEDSEFPTDIDALDESGGSEDDSLDMDTVLLPEEPLVAETSTDTEDGEDVMIDTVPLPEEPLEAEASADTEDGGNVMIGTWPTPEAPSKMETGDPEGESGGIEEDSIDMDSDESDPPDDPDGSEDYLGEHTPETTAMPSDEREGRWPPDHSDGSDDDSLNTDSNEGDPPDVLPPTDEYKGNGTLVDPDGNIVELPGQTDQADGTRDQEEDSMTPEEAARQAVEEAEEAARVAERAENAAAAAEEAAEEALDNYNGLGDRIGALNLQSVAKEAALQAEAAQKEAEDAEKAAKAAVAEALGEEPPDPRGSFLIAEDESDGESEGDLAAPFIPGGSVLSAATSDGNGSEDSDDE